MRKALVTGGGNGVGAAICRALVDAGVFVWVNDIYEERAVKVAADLGGDAHAKPVKCDVTSPLKITRMREETGPVDILVNNAGIPKRRHTRELDAATVDSVMQVNFLGPIRLTLALLPQMIERGGGRIVNVSSVAATLSSPGEAAYDASKAALSVFSEAMAIDLWDDGIKVLVVYPGVVDTPLFTQPDNDPFTAPVEFITVGELVQETFAALDRDALEAYIPAYFKDIVTGKANDVEGFVAGTAEYMRQQRAGTS